VCGQSFKTIFWIIEKSPWEHYISKKLLKFRNQFLYFQSCNYKIFMKIHYVSKILLYVQNIPKKHVDKWFFCFKSPFSLSNVHQIISIFLWTLIYSTRRDHVFKTFKKQKYIYLFRFWYSNILKHYYSFWICNHGSK